ncbi:MAG: PEP/pyruvate-binding domain-containing protein [Thermodesulfobacteriota bacterium]
MQLETESKSIKSGIPALDQILKGLRLGDNVVWQVDDLEDYLYFVRPFADQAIRESRNCVYLRFAPHKPIIEARSGLIIKEIDPGNGFDSFSSEVHQVIEEWSRMKFFVLDNLSALVEEWATDELLANFFQITCPFLRELNTVAYFALTRGHHANSTVARIRDTTQVLLDVYRIKGKMYLHPLKVWDRYSPQMFIPHEVADRQWKPVFQSGEAAKLSATARKHPLRTDESSIAPWDSVYNKLLQYRETNGGFRKTTPEIVALKQEFSRMLIGNHPEIARLADFYFTMEDLFCIRDRLIGSGRVGGKAAGMILARRILLEKGGETDFSQVLENHDSFYIGSDVFFTFLVDNNLFRLRLKLSRDSQLSHEEFEDVEQSFLAGRFSADIVDQFRNMLDYFGQAPIIVRSSSLLEDSFGNSFAGKYRSEFCVNQGSPDERLEAFLRAVKLVYASTLSPDALSYRRKRGLGESDEQMAILVQRVSGLPYRHYFFPSLAGVAFSRNLYAWTDRIDQNKGLIRLVFGLGTRAVNRVGGDYPRMVAISHPRLRPEVGMEIAKYSQYEIDLLDLEKNQFITLPTAEVISDDEYPNLQLLVSIMKDEDLHDPYGKIRLDSREKLVLTFNKLIIDTDFVKIIGDMLQVLDKAYSHAVDTEFTAFVDTNGSVKINLLQCRPLWLPGLSGPLEVPGNVPRERTLFKAAKVISGGAVSKIQYIIYIDPRRYAEISSIELKRSVGRIVGQLNSHPQLMAGKFLMMGPGRWGSSNIDLGVSVSYADIDNTAVLVEIAREDSGHVPEVSYGTHFFQDLVEAQIIYLPVYPDDPETWFNDAFFEGADNLLTDLLPGTSRFENVVRVIHVPYLADGAYAQVVADPQAHSALCFLE